MLPARHFYMMRHGETEANLARVMAGHTDSPLTELGRRQAKSSQAVLTFLNIKPQAILHSHLSRARDTASILNEVLGVPIHEDRDLSEMHVGIFEVWGMKTVVLSLRTVWTLRTVNRMLIFLPVSVAH